MNTLERQARNNQIAVLKARGLSYEQIAATVGVDRATAVRVMTEWRSTNPTLRTQDPLEIVDEMLEGYQHDLGELAMVSNSTKNEAVRVGAINARMAARDRIVALLQSTGVLPHDLGKLQIEIDVRFLAQRIVTLLEKYELPEAAHDELLEILGSAEPAERSTAA